MSPSRFSHARPARRLRGALALMLLVGIAALAACVPRDAQRTTVRFWAIGREGEVLGT